MQDKAPEPSPRFRRRVHFGDAQHQRVAKRPLLIMIVLLILTLWAMYRLSQISRGDAPGRQFLDATFGPSTKPPVTRPEPPPTD